MALTDKLRAAVFARDKGICAFSGLSLWILDQVMPVWHHDWPDHVRPLSRGGSDYLDNLVCASFAHNYKKRNNSADCSYLFLEGKPTEMFFWTHGELGDEQAEILHRHNCLGEADWYFNRALACVGIALQQEWSETRAVRDTRYWLGSALKRLHAWRRLANSTDSGEFIRRRLVRFPDAPDVRLMLQVTAADEDRLASIYDALRPHYAANADCLYKFAEASTPEARLAVLSRAEKSGKITEPLLAVLRRNIERLAAATPVRGTGNLTRISARAARVASGKRRTRATQAVSAQVK
jgi:hypothetical protein